MQWAEGGSLDDFIDVRLGRRSTTHPASTPAPENNSPQTTKNQPLSRGARIRAFRAMQSASPEDREKRKQELAGNISGSSTCQTDWKAVHLLSAEEVKSLFQDVVEGLSFLVSLSIDVHKRDDQLFDVARQVNLTPGPQTWQRPVDMG